MSHTAHLIQTKPTNSLLDPGLKLVFGEIDQIRWDGEQGWLLVRRDYDYVPVCTDASHWKNLNIFRALEKTLRHRKSGQIYADPIYGVTIH